MDLKWQVAMDSMRKKKFYKKTGRKLQFDAKEPVGFDKTKVECYSFHKTGHFARECRSKGNQDSRRRDVNASRAKKFLEKSHDPLALVAHTGSSSRQTSSYYVTHPTSVVDYDDENQAIIQGDRKNIQSRNSGNTGRNSRRAYVQEEVVEGMNAPKEIGNVQRTLRTPSLSNSSTVQCYNCSGKGHYAMNYPKPRVRDSKYFMEQMFAGQNRMKLA
ncbi:ribonuclease H-like domain-containing protein [Tanacetum coccineum]|uniref:Ribonuclease H-like domain-containing protein n=1 Tax=Tanacetum coccineum TaxID=301880 RepID=A0ABQ4YPQ6_9ASTR